MTTRLKDALLFRAEKKLIWGLYTRFLGSWGSMQGEEDNGLIIPHSFDETLTKQQAC